MATRRPTLVFLRAGALGGAVAALCDVVIAVSMTNPPSASAAALLWVVATSLFVVAGGACGAVLDLALVASTPALRATVFATLRDQGEPGAFARAALAVGVGAGAAIGVGTGLAAPAFEQRSPDLAALSVALALAVGLGAAAIVWRSLRRARLWRATTSVCVLATCAAGLLAVWVEGGGAFEAIDARPIFAIVAGVVCASLAALRWMRPRVDSAALLGAARAPLAKGVLAVRVSVGASALGVAAFSIVSLSADPDVRAASEGAPLAAGAIDRARGWLHIDDSAPHNAALARLALVSTAHASPLAPPSREPVRERPSTPLVLPAAPAPPVAASKKPHHLVLITIDALRADHLGAYGYARRTSPSLDAFAKSATLFERAYSQETKTKGSIPSMLTSRWPSDIRWGGRRYVPLAESEATLAERLLAAGYHTAAFVTHSYFMPGQGMDRGFVHYDASLVSRDPAVAFGRPSSSALADRAISYLARAPSGRPFFLWAHFFDPHERYLVHPGFSRFGARAIDRYDGEIAYTDHHVGRLLGALARHPQRDRIAIVVTSDHGEAFGEHGTRFHGQTLYEEEIRVPLIVRVPGATASRVQTPVGVIDVAPTLFDLAGLEPASEHRGRSLVPAARRARFDARPVYAEILPEDRIGARSAIVHGDWKLLYDERRDLLRLYHLRDDPGERHNRLRRDALVASELAALLFRWRARNVPVSPSPLGRAHVPSRTLYAR